MRLHLEYIPVVFSRYFAIQLYDKKHRFTGLFAKSKQCYESLADYSYKCKSYGLLKLVYLHLTFV